MRQSHQKYRWFFRTGNLWFSTSTLVYPRGISSHWPSDLIWLPPETDQTRLRGPRKVGHRRSGGAQQSGDETSGTNHGAIFVGVPGFSDYFTIIFWVFHHLWSFMKIWVFRCFHQKKMISFFFTANIVFLAIPEKDLSETLTQPTTCKVWWYWPRIGLADYPGHAFTHLARKNSVVPNIIRSPPVFFCICWVERDRFDFMHSHGGKAALLVVLYDIVETMVLRFTMHFYYAKTYYPLFAKRKLLIYRW